MSEQEATPEPAEAPVELGDAGKKAIAKEREARKQAEATAADFKKRLEAIEAEKLTELEKAQKAAADAAIEVEQLRAQIADKDLHILKQAIGGEFNLPAELVDRLQGDDEESLRADAKSLAELVADKEQSPFPKPDPSQGVHGSVVTRTTAERFADAMKDRI